MTHRAARPVGDAVVGDPHWHVHISIANLAQAADGKWLTVAAGWRELMRHAAAIDKVALHDVPAGFEVSTGMPVTADMKVGRRTVLSYLLGRMLPIGQEAMREP